jgi:hypothetical protein
MPPPLGLVIMKNVFEVLRSKEIDLERLRNEVEALRIVAPLLGDRMAETVEVERKTHPDLVWAPALEKNKWPLKVGQPGPTYSDS